jgi:L-lactate dehydrogenase
MNVGIVGTGYVGATAAYAMVLRGSCSQLVLVDKNEARAIAEAADVSHAAPVSHPVRVRHGQYADLAGSSVIVIAAGVNQKPGETRLELLSRNAAIFREIVPRILEAAPDAVLLVATNPVDVLTELTARVAGETHRDRVIGSGTVLDTARYRALLAARAGVDPQHVHGYVLGEHGDSEVLAWSRTDIAGLGVPEFFEARGLIFTDELRAEIEESTRHAARAIIAGKGATYYGIGAALARITEAVLRDARAVLTVSAPTPAFLTSLSLPRIVGGSGLLGTLPLSLSSDEQSALEKSASVLREATAQL